MKFSFFQPKESVNKVFFGLFLKEQEGVGLIMKMGDENLTLVEEEKFKYSNGWQNLSEDIDQLILKLEQRINLHLKETIFFVYSHFIDEKTNEIKKVYLDKIKELTKKLDLKALGYIECYEAISHYIETKEEAPFTAVLIELDQGNISVFIYKRGQMAYSKVLANSENFIDDLLACFHEIKGKYLLPSRIILYNSKDLDEESTQIVTHRWSEDLFIQLPRVEIIKEHEVIQALLGIFSQQYKKQKINVEVKKENVKNEILGFVIGEDVAEKKITERPTFKAPTLPISLLSEKTTKYLKKLKSLPQLLSKKWTVALGITLILLGIFLNEYFFHKANLTLFLPSETIKKAITLTDSDLSIKTATKTLEVSDSLRTTGKKEVGEKARGSATIHNFDDKEKTFNKGMSLETAGVKFGLDQDVKVASASVVTISGGLVKQPGKTKANVTAIQIGPQGNIASGKQFKIEDLSITLYFAVNDSAFSGGTKKELKTVSKQDMEDLKAKVLAKAKLQKLGLDGKKDSDAKILKDLTEFIFSEAKFDKEMGEEASSFSLEAKLTGTIYSYKEKELTDRLLKFLSQDLKKGFNLQKDKLVYEIKKADKTGKKIELEIDVTGKSLRDVPNKEVIAKVKGKGRDALGNLLKENFGAEGFELDIEPKFPIIQKTMPLFEKNISLKISSL